MRAQDVPRAGLNSCCEVVDVVSIGLAVGIVSSRECDFSSAELDLEQV